MTDDKRTAEYLRAQRANAKRREQAEEERQANAPAEDQERKDHGDE